MIRRPLVSRLVELGSRLAHMGRLPAATVALLALAVVLNQLVVVPRLAQLRRLEVRREALLRQQADAGRRDLQLARLARGLRVADLRELSQERPVDPATHIGSLVRQARLSRQELSIQPARSDSVLRSVQATVRVTGDFARQLQFIRAVELGPPLASVEAVKIEPLLDSQTLEGRFTISLYGATRGGRP